MGDKVPLYKFITDKIILKNEGSTKIFFDFGTREETIKHLSIIAFPKSGVLHRVLFPFLFLLFLVFFNNLN